MKYKYFNREVSWLSYNRRVLDEAADANLPVNERLRFLAIFASNLDEFYKVKIYAYHSLKNENDKETLKLINSIVSTQQKEFNHLLFESVIPHLSSEGVELVNLEYISREQEHKAEKYYKSELMTNLQPVLLSKKANVPFLLDNTLYLVVSLCKRKSNPEAQRKQRLALIRIPFTDKNRFVEIGEVGQKKQILLVEDIVRLNLCNLFPGYDISGSYSIKMLRNADFQVDENEEGHIVDKIEEAVSKREIGEPCLLVYDRYMPDDIKDTLINSFHLGQEEILPAGRYLRLSDLMYFPFRWKNKLNGISSPINPLSIDNSKSLLKNIKKQEILLHFPYHSFEYVTQFLNEAAFDKKVTEIKITWYRVARKSAVANALLTAANNGKNVTVFVELKARFDEEQNLYFARLMENAGIKIIYTLPGLKVHAKMILVRRIGKKKGERRYVFLSTGNFNEKTATLYTDHGLFSSNPEICDEVYNLFLDIENGDCCRNYKYLLVAPVNLKEEIIRKIDREIENQTSGDESGLIFKMNGLQNKKIINKLYEASLAGVKIELIVRGICCLVPNQPFSENITVRRIVDQYLEHGRIYVFHNRGNKEIYMGSADMMTRNLERRVELLFPVINQHQKREILDIMDIYLADNVKASYINESLDNIPVSKAAEEEAVRSQNRVGEYLSDKSR